MKHRTLSTLVIVGLALAAPLASQAADVEGAKADSIARAVNGVGSVDNQIKVRPDR